MQSKEDIQAVITMEDAKVSCNFEQVEAAIQGTFAEYKGAVFTEDSKAYAKKVVAGLRAQKKAFQDNLREEKKKYMLPWDEFEAKARQLISMYDEPIDLINGQVQAFEEKRVTEKKSLINTVFSKIVPVGLIEYIPLNRIYNPRWENATVKEKEIIKELSELVEKVQKDIGTINSMESEAVPKALSIYKEKLDVAEAVSYISAYERQKHEILAREQERRRTEEEERIRNAERERLLAERRAQEEKEAAVERAKEEGAQEAIESLIPDAGGETELYEYRVSLSRDAKEKLEMYMDSVGIEWEII